MATGGDAFGRRGVRPFIMGTSTLAVEPTLRGFDVSEDRIVRWTRPTPPPPRPDPPTNLHFTAKTTTTITLAWTASVSANADRYVIYERLATDPTFTRHELAPGVLTLALTGLLPHTQYEIQASAETVDFAEGDHGPSIFVTTNAITPPPPQRPAKPRNLRVTGRTSASITLAWDANTETDLINYRVYQWNPAAGGGGIARTVTIPPGTFDDTGTLDITQALNAWLNNGTHVPKGTGSGDMTRVLFPADAQGGGRAIYRLDGGINGGLFLNGLNWVVLDGGGTPGALGLDGARFVQVNSRGGATPNDVPFQETPGIRNHPSFTAGGAGNSWSVFFVPGYGDPTVVNKRTFTGSSAETQAKQLRDTLNRTRSMFVPGGCTGLKFAHAELIGSYDGTAFNDSYESQDGIRFEGCTDVEIDDCTIHNFWGQCFEAVRDADTGLGTIGLWVHDSNCRRTGRQIASLTHGGSYIIEDNFLGDSQRTLIDCEPVTGNVDTRRGFTTTVQGLFLLRNTIGDHGLGFLGMHPGVSKVRVDGCTGQSVGTSGACLAEQVVWENVTSNDTNPPHTLCQFGREFTPGEWTGPADQNPWLDNHTGRHFGGRNLLVQDCTGVVGGEGVLLSASNEGCDNFKTDLQPASFHNLANATMPNVDTNGQTNSVPFTTSWLTGKNSLGKKTIDIPSHALRDGGGWEEVTPPVGVVAFPSKLIDSLAPSTDYRFQVIAFNPQGASDPAEILARTLGPAPTVPAMPTGFTATPVANAANMQLAWNANAPADNVTIYTVYYKRQVDSAFSTADTSGVSMTLALAPSTAYDFYLVATNSIGDSPATATIQATTQSVALVAPSALTHTAVTQTSVTLAWAGNNPGASFHVYRLSPGPTALVATTGATSALIPGLTAATVYQFYVAAFVGAGPDGPVSNTHTVTTSPPSNPPPAAPSSLSVAYRSFTRVGLIWNPNIEPDLASYTVWRRLGTSGTFVQIDGVIAQAVPYLAVGLVPETVYQFQVRAVDSVNQPSPASNTVMVTTTAAPLIGQTTPSGDVPAFETFKARTGRALGYVSLPVSTAAGWTWVENPYKNGLGYTGPDGAGPAYRKVWRDYDAVVEWPIQMFPGDNALFPATQCLAVYANPNYAGYDAHYDKCGLALRDSGFPDAIIRIGWELNGDKFRWRVRADHNDSSVIRRDEYVNWWRRVAHRLKATPGTNFRLVWAPSIGNWLPSDAANHDDLATYYPGDDVCDVVGFDVYDQVAVAYPGATAAWNWMLTGHNLGWNLAHDGFGLNWLASFATTPSMRTITTPGGTLVNGSGHKPMAFPEWGFTFPQNSHTGGDNAHFIEMMADWIQDPAHDVLYANFFGGLASSPNALAKYQTVFPAARVADPTLSDASLLFRYTGEIAAGNWWGRDGGVSSVDNLTWVYGDSPRYVDLGDTHGALSDNTRSGSFYSFDGVEQGQFPGLTGVAQNGERRWVNGCTSWNGHLLVTFARVHVGAGGSWDGSIIGWGWSWNGTTTIFDDTVRNWGNPRVESDGSVTATRKDFAAGKVWQRRIDIVAPAETEFGPTASGQLPFAFDIGMQWGAPGQPSYVACGDLTSHYKVYGSPDRVNWALVGEHDYGSGAFGSATTLYPHVLGDQVLATWYDNSAAHLRYDLYPA